MVRTNYGSAILNDCMYRKIQRQFLKQNNDSE